MTPWQTCRICGYPVELPLSVHEICLDAMYCVVEADDGLYYWRYHGTEHGPFTSRKYAWEYGMYQLENLRSNLA